MHVVAVSAILDTDKFWNALKTAYGRLPQGAEWAMAAASTDGTRAVNVIVGAPAESVRLFFDEYTRSAATTECFEVDAANAVGLPGGATAPSEPVTVIPAPASEQRRPGNDARAAAGVDWTAIEARLSDLLAAYRIPSAQVAVLRNGEISEIAVGVRDIRSAEPVTAETIYQIGSMSKTWTALAFMQLVDEGKVGLDEPVRRYLPGFRVADRETSAALTPRRLLNHTNGIEELFGDPGEGEDAYERMVAYVADAPQVFPLGETHGYSAALGYAILARIAEVVDGRPWDAILRARLFEPLRLTSTSSWRGDLDRSRAATGHIVRSLDEGPIVAPVQFLPRAFGPGGNVSSTAREVLTMASVFLDEGRALDGTRILSAEGIREMMTSRVAIPDPYMFGPWWALGLIVCDWGGETVYAHDGSTIGQNARLRILPHRNLAVAMLTNGGPRESFYRQAFSAILAELGSVTVPDLPAPDAGLELGPGRYTGTYERPGIRYEVTAVGGNLHLTLIRDAGHARASGQPERTTRRLLPIDETHFLVPRGDPLEDTESVAIYDVRDGAARYLHTNCRAFPRVDGRKA